MSRDLDAFERHLDRLQSSRDPRMSPLFERQAPLFVARAPGRLDVMGGFADYSGSLTLEMPIAEGTFVAAQRTAAPVVRILSAPLGPEAVGDYRYAEFSVEELRPALQSHAAAREYFRRHSEGDWAAYVAGSLVPLLAEPGRVFGGPALPPGLSLLVASSVPEGKGVSSSAAVEVASYYALAALSGLAVDPVRAAFACQSIENLVVGAPCGVMDQMTSSCGAEGELLALLCQPARLEPTFRVPEGLALWGIDSGLRHQVSGADYTEVRVAAFMGYAMIARALGLPIEAPPGGGVLEIRDPKYGGYLANVPPATFEAEYEQHLPELCTGELFLQQFAGISDPITHVRRGSSYRVRAATAHPIYEHQRAREFRQMMLDLSGPSRGDVSEVGPRLGALMYAAHESYSACGLGSTGTDRIVNLVRELGPAEGLYGAKITGGGSGGTVAVLGRDTARPAIDRVLQLYARESGGEPYLFSGSSPGAAQFGVRQAKFMASAWKVGRANSEPSGISSPRRHE
jgi:galactokinase